MQAAWEKETIPIRQQHFNEDQKKQMNPYLDIQTRQNRQSDADRGGQALLIEESRGAQVQSIKVLMRHRWKSQVIKRCSQAEVESNAQKKAVETFEVRPESPKLAMTTAPFNRKSQLSVFHQI